MQVHFLVETCLTHHLTRVQAVLVLHAVGVSPTFTDIGALPNIRSPRVKALSSISLPSGLNKAPQFRICSSREPGCCCVQECGGKNAFSSAYIYRNCLLRYNNGSEVEFGLCAVWQKLVEQNPEFFDLYNVASPPVEVRSRMSTIFCRGLTCTLLVTKHKV